MIKALALVEDHAGRLLASAHHRQGICESCGVHPLDVGPATIKNGQLRFAALPAVSYRIPLLSPPTVKFRSRCDDDIYVHSPSPSASFG